MSPGSPAKSAHHSPLKASLQMQMQMQSPDKSGARGATGSHSGAGAGEAGATFIPFAQRQAKSQVAAREILKRGQKVSYCFYWVLLGCRMCALNLCAISLNQVHHVDLHAKTDTLLKEQIEEYDR